MEKKYVAIGGVLAIGALLFLMSRRDGAQIPSLVADNPWLTPYITDGKTPGQGMTTNVNVKVDAFAGLSNQYMPVFGFVGVGVTGDLPTRILNVNTIQNTAPPPRVVQESQFVAPNPPIQPSGWNLIPPNKLPSRGSFGGF